MEGLDTSNHLDFHLQNSSSTMVGFGRSLIKMTRFTVNFMKKKIIKPLISLTVTIKSPVKGLWMIIQTQFSGPSKNLLKFAHAVVVRSEPHEARPFITLERVIKQSR